MTLEDTDFIAPPTPESITDENEKLREALLKGDDATFAIWLEGGERALKADAKEHAEFLVRAATIMQAANKHESAVTLAKRAMELVVGVGDTTEAMVMTYLRTLGGESAVREAIGKSIVSVQKELIEIQSYEYLNRLRTPEEEERNALRIQELKIRNQALANLKSAF